MLAHRNTAPREAYPNPHSGPAPMARLDQVTMDTPRKRVLDRVSLDINPGEVVRLIGDSGSGKTSMMRMLIGLEKPTGGTVEVFGYDTAAMSRRARKQQIAQGCGIVFQSYPLLGNFSGADNIFLPHEQRGIRFDVAARSRVAGLVGAVGLRVGQLAGRASELSGGEAQRISFVSALAHEPHLLLMDEPTSAQDPKKKAIMYQMVRDYVDEVPESRAALVITHDHIQRGIVNRQVEVTDGHITTPLWPTAPTA